MLKLATASFIEELENDAATAAEQEEEVEVNPKKKGKHHRFAIICKDYPYSPLIVVSAGGFSAPVQLSEALSNFLGEVVLPRTEVRVVASVRTSTKVVFIVVYYIPGHKAGMGLY